MSAYTRRKAKSKYIDRIRLEGTSQQQSSGTTRIPYGRVKQYRKCKRMNAAERINDDVSTSAAGAIEITSGGVGGSMWSRKQSVCSALSGVSRADDPAPLYPFAIALRVRVLQIVCGISGLVVGAVGWLEERRRPALGLGVPAGALTVIAAATSVYFSRGFGGWRSPSASWGAPWRALGPSLRAAVPLTLLWTAAVAAHTAMVAFCIRSLLNLGCGSPTCVGVAGAQLAVSATTLASAGYMVRLDLVYDAARSPPPRCPDGQTCTGVSMVPLTSVALGGDGQADCGGSPPKTHEEKEMKEEETAVLEKSDVQT